MYGFGGHENSSVAVSTSTNEDNLRLNIRDKGIGIPQDKSMEVFKPFSRLGIENSSIPGMGLGLAQAKALIESLGGRIGFNSSKTGTTFWIDIPCK
ncbi:MAG: ATP-binding protein [Gammaproteobacteria bacterium]|nr:ATP-binding protein [Gammaproteobacteria bacterium]